MFRFLVRLVFRLLGIRPAPQRRDVFFEYFDGQRWRKGDPFRIFRALVNDKDFDAENHKPLALAGREPEAAWFVAAVCRAFDVTQWDEATGQGLTQEELFWLYGEFAEFTSAEKKSG